MLTHHPSNSLSEIARQSTRVMGPRGFRLWGDGLGGYRVWWEAELTIGRVVETPSGADLQFLAPLSRKHLHLRRDGEDLMLQPQGACQVGDRSITERSVWLRGQPLTLSNTVKLGFRVPSRLSSSICLDFLSAHRPVSAEDGLVWMTELLLIGPGRDSHLVFPGLGTSVVLKRNGDQLWCHSQELFKVDESAPTNQAPCPWGSTITGKSFRIRIEGLS